MPVIPLHSKHASFHSPAARRSRSLSCALARALFLFALLSAATAHAQSDTGVDSDPADPGTGGSNTIQGRIFVPEGGQLNRRVRVRLSGTRGESYAMTNDNGAFTFRRLAGGTYQLSVNAGGEFEPASETVDILDPAFRGGGTRGGQIVSVEIRLQPKQADGAKASVVNAALASIPKPARELYNRALASAQSGETRKAVEDLKKAVALHPGFVLALNELGVQYLKLGEHDKAADALRAAIKLAPDAPVLRLNYGMILLQQRRFDAAEAELRRAAEINDAFVSAHLYRGRALIGLGRYDDAERELQRALSLGGGAEASMAHRYLGAIYIERGQSDKAVTELETYLRLEPKAREAAQIREMITRLRASTPPPKK